MTHPIDYRVNPKADGTAARAFALAVMPPEIEPQATGRRGKKGGGMTLTPPRGGPKTGRR